MIKVSGFNRGPLQSPPFGIDRTSERKQESKKARKNERRKATTKNVQFFSRHRKQQQQHSYRAQPDSLR